MRKLILALLLTLMAASLAAADTLYLRDGRAVRGTVLGFISGRFAVRLTAAIGPPLASQARLAISSSSARATSSVSRLKGVRWMMRVT
jgi:hypothetical protein